MRRSALREATLGLLAVTAVLAGCGSGGHHTSERQAEVAERGAQVMPFDLDATTHRFEATSFGGVQTVVADDPDDADQVRLIREHLAAERDRFAAGDFADPARIHGHEMPGLSALEAGFRDITVAYDDVPAGARLTYRAGGPALVEALHLWFAAQLSDHGAHATGG